jgi:membrane-bound metal-dependent hydrolase YbcI (DUF457 family)
MACTKSNVLDSWLCPYVHPGSLHLLVAGALPSAIESLWVCSSSDITHNFSMLVTATIRCSRYQSHVSRNSILYLALFVQLLLDIVTHYQSGSAGHTRV